MAGFETVGELIESARFRAALAEAMRLATLVNRYTSDQAPWALIESDRERAAPVLYVALRAIDSLKTHASCRSFRSRRRRCTSCSATRERSRGRSSSARSAATTTRMRC